MKKIAVLTALSAIFLSVTAEEIKISKPKVQTQLSRKMEINTAKDYTFTINAEGGKGKLIVYLYQFDKSQRRIGMAHINGKTDSLTELTAPAIAGTTEFTVKDASKWLKPGSGTNIVAFRAKADSSDIPNFTIDYYSKSITKLSDGTWKIEMKNPLRRSHPAGTLVRQHIDGGHLQFAIPLPMKKPFKVTIKAEKGPGFFPYTWWRGAAYVQPTVMVTDGTPVVITDWSLKEGSAASVPPKAKAAPIAPKKEVAVAPAKPQNGLTISTPNKWVDATDYIPVNNGESYEFRCNISGGTGKVTAIIYQYNKNKRRIGYHNITGAPETYTTLVQPSVKGQTSIVVADASKWDVPKKGRLLVFDAKADESDLPNHNLCYYLKSVSKVANGYKVEFDRPLFFGKPAGCGVRVHRDGGALSAQAVLPMKTTWKKVFEKEGANVNIMSRLWKGTAYVKVVLLTTSKEPIKVTECSFVPVSGSKPAAAPVTPEKAASSPAVTPKMGVYGSQKILKQTADEAVFLNRSFKVQNRVYNWSGTTMRDLSIPASEVKQFEFDLKSKISCFVRVMFILKKKDGKALHITTVSKSTIPDGNYRRYIFHPQDSAQWDNEAVLTGWTIRIVDYDDIGKEMGIRNPRILSGKNIIPGAEFACQGKDTLIHDMRPIGKYKLSWKNGTCPGVKLKFFNHRMEEIPNSELLLKKGQKEITFTAPERMIYATASIEGKGSGYPQIDCLHWQIRYKPELFWKGKWIWSRFGKGPDYAYVWFERTFDLEEKPEYAVLGLMADDKSEIYINGERVGATFRYSIPDRFTITDQLQKGKNTITVRVYNLDSAAGLCADLYWKNANGKEGFILTDKQWLCHENGTVTEKPAAIASPTVELGDPANTAPWSAYIGFIYVGPRGRFTLKTTENGKFTAVMNRTVISLFRTLLFERRTASGKVSKFLLPASMTKNADGTVTVNYPKIRPTNEPSKVYLIDDFWEITGGKALAELPAVETKPTEFQKAEFVKVGNRTKLKFRGKLWNPAFYLNRYPERKDAIQKIGVNSYSLSCEFTELWRGVNQYNFTKLDTTLELLMTMDPEAIFILDIGLYMPDWWLEAYPDEASAYFEGTRRNTYDDVQALASKRWLKDSEAPIKAIIDHLKAKGYADRIWAFNISNGRGSEWFWGGASAGTDFYRKRAHPGYSPADYRTFRGMLRKWHKTDEALAKAWNMPGLTIETAKMPNPTLRKNGAVGSLFDPTKNAQLMDWFRFRNESLAEAINYFGHYIKKVTGNNTMVGCYYGYWITLAESGYRSQLITGHNGFMTCLREDAVDFFRAPSRYNYRRPGDPNGIMMPYSSFMYRNKVVFIENDQRTAYAPSQGDANDVYVCRPSTPIESVGQINREFGMSYATGVSHYWYENPPGSFYEPAIVAALDDQYKAVAKLPAVKGYTPVETAIVCDVESIYHSIDGNQGIFPPAIKGLFLHYNRLGAPFSNVVVDDLTEGKAPAHKLYVMLPTLVLSKAQRAALQKRFEQEKATVLWLYSAGSSYPDKGPSAEFCGDFFGMKFSMDTKPQIVNLLFNGEKFQSRFTNAPWFFPVSGYDSVLAKDDKGRPAVVMKKVNGATHIFSALPDLPKSMLDAIVKKSGVFQYVKTFDDPVWAGNDIVTLHAATTGKKQIFLPKGKNLKPILGPMKKTVRSGEAWEAIGGQSYVFLVTE